MCASFKVLTVGLLAALVPSVALADGTYGKWQYQPTKKRYVVEYKYKNNTGAESVQHCVYYPQDEARKNYYYWIKKGSENYWARCVRPKTPEYDPKVMKWYRRDTSAKKWTFLPGGECPPPPDANRRSGANILVIPDPPI